MFFRYTPMRASNHGFGIGNNSMNPRKKLSRCSGVPKDHLVMTHTLIFGCSSLGSPPIGTDRIQKLSSFFGFRSATEPFHKILNNACRSFVDHPHMGEPRTLYSLPISIKRYRAQDRTFILAPSSSLLSPGAEKRIVHFDQSGKTISGIPIRHRLANFVSHQPRGPVLLDLQDSLHLRDRHSHFVHRHMVEQPIPFHQRSPRALKNSSCCNARLKATILAVKQFSLRKMPGFVMSALRTDKTMRPSLLRKVLRTSLFIRERVLELYQAIFCILLGHLSICPRTVRQN